MAHGILERDFVKNGVDAATDWHKKTLVMGRALTFEDFPEMKGEDLYNADGRGLVIDGKPWRVPVTKDDGLPCGKPFCSDTFTLFTPRQGWQFVSEILAGTGYTVERIGMLWNRSKWFVSAQLHELKQVSRKGEAFQLNFSGGIDGTMSPQAELSAIRAVCWNTISLSRMTGKALFKRKLTSGFNSALESAKAQIEKAVGMAAVFNAAMMQAEETACEVQTAREIYMGATVREDIAKVAKISTTARNTVDGLVALYQRGDGNKGQTLADVVNGFTQYGTMGFESSRKDVWTQLESSEFGRMADRNAEFVGNVFSPERRDGRWYVRYV
mgnify:FL=1